jgi:LPXTG-motif cell wall-anchored protein
MIQRVQSIYLLLAFTCVVLLILFPLFSMTAVSNALEDEVSVSAEFGAYGLVFSTEIDSMAQSTTQYHAFGMLADNPQSGKMSVYLLYISMSLLTLAALLLYKKRKRQLLFARLSFIIHLLVLVGIFAFYYLGTRMIKTELPATADLTITFALEPGFYLMLASIPFLYLAIRGIKNDENLVKSLDRLR